MKLRTDFCGKRWNDGNDAISNRLGFDFSGLRAILALFAQRRAARQEHISGDLQRHPERAASIHPAATRLGRKHGI